MSSQSNNAQPKSPCGFYTYEELDAALTMLLVRKTEPKSHFGVYTHEEMEAALSMLTVRNPVVFSDKQGQGTAERPGAISGAASSSNAGVSVPAVEAEKKAPKKISLAEYIAMKKARAAREEAERK